MDVVSLEMLLYLQNQVDVPVPEAKILQKFSELQYLFYAHGLKSPFDVVLDEVA